MIILEIQLLQSVNIAVSLNELAIMLKELFEQRKNDFIETQKHYIFKNEMVLQRFLFLIGMFHQPNRP